MLLRRVWDLHAPRPAYGWVRHVAVTSNLIAASRSVRFRQSHGPLAQSVSKYQTEACWHLVSTMTTRLCKSSASTRAISLITVVLPTPGRPKKRMELGTSQRGQLFGSSPAVYHR